MVNENEKSGNWYLKLLQPLIKKIKTNEQKEAEKELPEFFTLLPYDCRDEDEDEILEEKYRYDSKEYQTKDMPIYIEILLGVIEQMYIKFGDCEDGSKEFSDFAKHLLSMTTLYSKMASDSKM